MNNYTDKNGVEYIPMQDIKNCEDLHEIAKAITFEQEGSFMPKTTTREQFLQEIKSEIEWYFDFVDSLVSKKILSECYEKILEIERVELMEDKDINQMIERIKELLKNDEEYENYELSYILIDKDDREEAKAIVYNADEIAQIDLKTNEISPVADWAYNIDEDVFGKLEDNKEIGYMSLDCHYGVWSEIEEYYPEDIEYKKGMQEYLKYCKENEITKDKLVKEVDYKGEDVMQYYKEKNKAKER